LVISHPSGVLESAGISSKLESNRYWRNYQPNLWERKCFHLFLESIKWTFATKSAFLRILTRVDCLQC